MTQSELQHIFEAFSTLSDAEAHVHRYLGLDHPSSKCIEHAKRHLMAVLDAHTDDFRGAVFASLRGCSLAAEAQELVERHNPE